MGHILFTWPRSNLKFCGFHPQTASAHLTQCNENMWLKPNSTTAWIVHRTTACCYPEIGHCCQYYLCILFLKSWEALRGSFFLKRKLPCLICFPQKLELYRISFSLCGLHDNVFKAFHVFCRVRGSFWPAYILLQGPVRFFLVRESLQMDAFRTATKR